MVNKKKKSRAKKLSVGFTCVGVYVAMLALKAENSMQREITGSGFLFAVQYDLWGGTTDSDSCLSGRHQRGLDPARLRPLWLSTRGETPHLTEV